jgi:hypothetical protein
MEHLHKYSREAERAHRVGNCKLDLNLIYPLFGQPLQALYGIRLSCTKFSFTVYQLFLNFQGRLGIEYRLLAQYYLHK